MCGIVAYIGDREACPILIKGLQRLEYRGYDSAGVAILDPVTDEINVYKIAGKVNDLKNFLTDKNTAGHEGMGHTRWATHGAPNNANAHPHLSDRKSTRLNSSHRCISYAVFCLKKKKTS